MALKTKCLKCGAPIVAQTEVALRGELDRHLTLGYCGIPNTIRRKYIRHIKRVGDFRKNI